MRPVRPDLRRGPARPGFALPLALFMLLVMSLLVALLLEGAVQELRIARGALAGARADAAAGSALADLLAATPDGALLALPRGGTSTGLVVSGAETTRVAVQSLGGGVIRVSAIAREWIGGVRGDAAHMVFARVLPDSSGPPGRLRYRRLPGWWWAQIP